MEGRWRDHGEDGLRMRSGAGAEVEGEGEERLGQGVG
jgi:hypothetical protein